MYFHVKCGISLSCCTCKDCHCYFSIVNYRHKCIEERPIWQRLHECWHKIQSCSPGVNAGIATLTLNRPGQYNALSEDMLIALQEALDDIAGDDTVRVVVIAANGKAFCAGHDLKEMRSSEDRAFHQALC